MGIVQVQDNFLAGKFLTGTSAWYRGADKSLTQPGRKHANISVRMAWISFGALPCKKKKELDDSSRLHVVEIARVPDMLPSLFPDRAKDLSSTQYFLSLSPLLSFSYHLAFIFFISRYKLNVVSFHISLSCMFVYCRYKFIMAHAGPLLS